MAETGGGITGNDDSISLRDFIEGHLGHLDDGLHDIQQKVGRIEAHLTAIQADLDAARPLLERFKRSGIARLVGGGTPWG